VSQDKYTGKAQDRRYTGQDADITYSLKRCIHAKRCVDHLSQVFDNHKRPWINADGAAAEDVARVVATCPSGALHFERKDGGAEEATPDENVITLWADGPLQFHGDLEIHGTTVDIDQETRATLCRCGASSYKPFCDNSHLNIAFSAADPQRPDPPPAVAVYGGRLKITATANGPLHVEGNMAIYNAAGELIFAGNDTWLCRCGGSGNKPFCDGTHNRSGFRAE
jgi:CDGSH-type Zn-finger protein/uncharacterized Fe-S cluster protein YjdI